MADRDAAPPQSPRIRSLDALRGSALCGMVAYHAAWDLSDLGWPVASPAASPAWTAFGGLVAGTFLLVSGAALALARPRGPGAAVRRLVRVAAAALAVTAASLWFAPDRPILFGILHCIAVADALALPTLRWPPAARLALAAAAAVAPALLSTGASDGWVGTALGLSAAPPRTLDYRPLLPWLAAVLVGTVMGERLARPPVRPAAPTRLPLAGLRWMGRHSLALYLLHQPVLYGALLLLRAVLGQPGPEPDPFGGQCRIDCVATGAAPRLCETACACTTARVAAEAQRPNAPGLTARHLDEIGAACRRGG